MGTYNLAIWLVRDRDAACLFEVGVASIVPLILGQLDAIGVPPEQVTQIILSHAHPDHASGQAGLLAGLPRAELWLSEASAKFLAKPSTHQAYAQEDIFTTNALRQKGDIPPNSPATAPTLLPEPYRVVAPGQTLDLGGLTLELGRADGHAPGGFTAWLPERQALLASDSAGFSVDDPPGLPLYFVSYQQYQQTMAELADFKPQILALGHQHWFQGQAVQQYLGQTRDDLARDHHHIRKAAATGRLHNDVAQELFDTYYPKNLTIFAPQGILDCCSLLVRRSLEE